MTFYQELQLNQAGSKGMIRNSKTQKEKYYHILTYLAKITITMLFCFTFVTAYSLIFGGENSIVGVVVLLCVMVFKNADFGVNVKESVALLILFFGLMIIGPHAANLAGPAVGMLVNMVSLFFIFFLGCYNPMMSNQSTLVLGYLLLYGYDVSGKSYMLRIIGLTVGCVMTCIVFYRNHVKRTYKIGIKDVLKAFRLESCRSRWQLCSVICVPLVVFIAEIFGLPRTMWAGIAAMSAIVPFMSDMKQRVRGRIIGNIAGAACFLALYFLLPPSIYAYIGIIGGIGVGFSVKYGWQAVFNTFGALAIAAEAYGLKEAVQLRIFQNIFGVVFALLFCMLFNKILKARKIYRNKEKGRQNLQDML